MMAMPVRQNSQVIGLLEVFSDKANGLDPDAEAVLRHLAETTAKVIIRSSTGLASEQAESLEDRPEESSSRFRSKRMMLIGVAVAILVAALILALVPWKRAAAPQAVQAAPQSTAVVAPQSTALRRQPSATGVADLASLRTLAQEGDPSAEFAVGARYATGQEVKQDYAQAIRWFTRAAEQGHVVSQATLGAYYWAGRGVPADLEKAYYWSVLAQNGGDQASKYRVAVLTSRLTHTQVAVAQQQANEWIRQHRGISQAVAREQVPQ
jgi:TPR repeat protein